MTPQALLAAYVAATGLPVTLSYAREVTLTELVNRNITPEDITSVMEELKKRIKRDTKGTYTWVSLEFRNAMDPDTLEERALTLRQRAKRVVPPKPQESRDTSTGFKVLDDPKTEDPKPLDVRGSLINLANNLRSA